MSTPASKAASPQAGLPASRTDSPMDAKDSNENVKSSEDVPETIVTTTSLDAPSTIPAPQKPGDDANGDYFSGIHSTSHLSFEPNPFEQSFGNTASDTPGKSILPPVASLTSPAMPGTSTSGGFNWPNSLRAGPLSPAMLAGPAGPNDYFDGITRGFPTPNESSLRTGLNAGLTPGGGGSMFPAPSPGPSALLQQLPSGNTTPTTLDFQRTAITAAKKSGFLAPTSNPGEADSILQQVAASMEKPQSYPFAHADATDAANGLFMLAKGAQATSNPFSGPTSQPMQMSLQNNDNNSPPMNGVPPQINEPNGVAPQSSGNMSDSPDTKINTRSKGKKATTAKGTSTNGRRKAEDTPKGSNKKQKAANTTAADKAQTVTDDDSVEFDNAEGADNGNSNGEGENIAAGNKKTMTDEEKKKNFKERNRVAALKCRQRKKQWVATLMRKAEAYSSDNEALSSLLDKVREENAMLKSMLSAHKDCPVGQSQGLSILLNGLQMNSVQNGLPAGPQNTIPNGIQSGIQNSIQNNLQNGMPGGLSVQGDLLAPQNWQLRR
ncbi:AtfA protein [Nannizzia gypsea CBS 118893]|uniref:AtfA protein n=1 Tax=Arthroderma gypseum (strain ATCC MYA-4604 / CBS 118893) TaxID=535722 RepID=E5R0A0_ARTGP|nr:AtfA protein [Nannizzia gypsea CBS 118893]EFQ98296.1 AtfA protein [Nannizzia gypsea CBS 118893]